MTAMTPEQEKALDKIEGSLSEIELALNSVDSWPREIIRAYQALSAACADFRQPSVI